MEIAEQILKDIPRSPMARYVKWQTMDDEDPAANILALSEIVSDARAIIAGLLDELNDEARLLYSTMLSDLASCLYFEGKKDEALDIAKEFMDADIDGNTLGRLVYYCTLTEKEIYTVVVDKVESDEFETPVGEYCNAISLFEMEDAGDEASDALINAISLDPDLVFYIMGLWDTEDIDRSDITDDDGYFEELVMDVTVLSELWSATEERLAFLGSVAFAFGYLSGRIDDAAELELLEDGYKNIGCLEEMRESRDVLQAEIASGKSQEEIDEEALSMFRNMRNQGFFN
jgi:tetratricopeptide (TPR) repeat protein